MNSRLSVVIVPLAALLVACGVEDVNSLAEIETNSASPTEVSEGAVCAQSCPPGGCVVQYTQNFGPSSECQVGKYVKPQVGIPTGFVEKIVGGKVTRKAYTKITASFDDPTDACRSLLRRTNTGPNGYNYDEHVGFVLGSPERGPHGQWIRELTCHYNNYQCDFGQCRNSSLSTSTIRTRTQFARIDACADWTPPILTLPTVVIPVRETTADGRSFVFRPKPGDFGARDWRPCDHRPDVSCTAMTTAGIRVFTVSSTATSIPPVFLPKTASQWTFECIARDPAQNVAVGTIVVSGP